MRNAPPDEQEGRECVEHCLLYLCEEFKGLWHEAEETYFLHMQSQHEVNYLFAHTRANLIFFSSLFCFSHLSPYI